jgi:hypothetical protein
MDVQFLPLVPNAPMPAASPATTRSAIPHGYGVQEQCLPFTAATALGLLIRSPIAFGVCASREVPHGAHSFRSPLARHVSGEPSVLRVFYVQDDSTCRFSGNAFTLEYSGGGVVPGLSFFDREDQQDLFKVHLPYVCRTSQGIDTLFLPPINRPAPFAILSGLVETDWYTSPVNLILRMPPGAVAAHVAKGDLLAQLVFIERSHRRPDVTILADHARMSRELKTSMQAWNRRHEADRSAYKKLVRTQHGQVAPDIGRRLKE